MRIVSLIASATEIVDALGFAKDIVARSHECDYPESIMNLPVCTAPKFKTDRSSYEIDQQVKALVQKALSVYSIDIEMLERLKPTHIITQDQCQVCAVSLSDLENAACELISSKPVIVSLNPRRLEDIWLDIKLVGTALGAQQKADQLVTNLFKQVQSIAKKAQCCNKLKVACIEWLDPLMIAGNWMPQLVDLAGGENLLSQAGKYSVTLDWNTLVSVNPDVIKISPCGFTIERTQSELHLLRGHTEYTKLKAVLSGKVYVADGNQFFNRPGPRIVQSLEIIAEMLHPEIFEFGHKGRAWVNQIN